MRGSWAYPLSNWYPVDTGGKCQTPGWLCGCSCNTDTGVRRAEQSWPSSPCTPHSLACRLYMIQREKPPLPCWHQRAPCFAAARTHFKACLFSFSPSGPFISKRDTLSSTSRKKLLGRVSHSGAGHDRRVLKTSLFSEPALKDSGAIYKSHSKHFLGIASMPIRGTRKTGSDTNKSIILVQTVN